MLDWWGGWGSILIQGKGGGGGKEHVGRGVSAGVTRNWDIMGWGIGGGGNQEVGYHLTCKQME